VKSTVEVLFDRRAPKRTLAIHSLKHDMSQKSYCDKANPALQKSKAFTKNHSLTDTVLRENC
jgi:hypothetical protein